MTSERDEIWFPFNPDTPPWRSTAKPWPRNICRWRYIYSFIEEDKISIIGLQDISGQSRANLARWSSQDKWGEERSRIESAIEGKTIAELDKRMQPEPVTGKDLVPQPESDMVLREQILLKVGAIADDHIETLHAAVEVQKKHAIAYKRKRELGSIYFDCLYHVIVSAQLGRKPEDNILHTLNILTARGGQNPIQTYDTIQEHGISGEEKVYGLIPMRELKAAEARIAAAGYAIVEAKALQEAKQLQEGEMEGEIVSDE